jgi:hypothetical protein
MGGAQENAAILNPFSVSSACLCDFSTFMHVLINMQIHVVGSPNVFIYTLAQWPILQMEPMVLYGYSEQVVNSHEASK